MRSPLPGRDGCVYLLRATRWEAVVAGAVCAGALATVVDEGSRQTLVTVVCLLGLSFVFDDPAAGTLACSPTSLRRRQVARLALVLPLAAGLWLAVSAVVVPGPGGLVPPASVVLESGSLAAVVLATAAAGGRIGGGAHAGSAAAAPVLLAFLGVVVSLPSKLALYPVAGHECRWLLVVTVALVVLVAAGRDPTARSGHRARVALARR